MGWVSGQQCVVLSIKTKSLCDSVKVEIISSLCWIPFLGFWSLRTEAGPYTRNNINQSHDKIWHHKFIAVTSDHVEGNI